MSHYPKVFRFLEKHLTKRRSAMFLYGFLQDFTVFIDLCLCLSVLWLCSDV